MQKALLRPNWHKINDLVPPDQIWYSESSIFEDKNQLSDWLMALDFPSMDISLVRLSPPNLSDVTQENIDN